MPRQSNDVLQALAASEYDPDQQEADEFRGLLRHRGDEEGARGDVGQGGRGSLVEQVQHLPRNGVDPHAGEHAGRDRRP